MKKLLFLLVAAGMFIACNNPNMKNDNTAAANKAKVARFYEEVINAHNASAIDSFCTNDFVDHTPDPGHSGKGLDDLRSAFKDFFAAYPDVHVTPQFITGGDTVTTLVRVTGTNTGPMGPNMPATNKSMDVMMLEALVIKDGKATDRWGYYDVMKMMQQLGMMPEPGSAPMDTTHKM